MLKCNLESPHFEKGFETDEQTNEWLQYENCKNGNEQLVGGRIGPAAGVPCLCDD
jgi:hypothetical protein